MLDSAPAVVEYEPVARDPEKEKPPIPYVVDITDRCYDGSCPFDTERL